MTQMPPLALLAGGLATRLLPLTEQVPKAMIEVAGEPFIAHQLRLVQREGISRVVLCVGYLWEQIREFVDDGRRFGVEVEYAVDGPKLLGTGGALRMALDKLGPEFMVMYGDSWLNTAFPPIVQAFRASRKPALMTVFRNDGRWDRSNVWFEDGEITLLAISMSRVLYQIGEGLNPLRNLFTTLPPLKLLLPNRGSNDT
jgi:NDP-sugar pyrophosphorylase family protein